MTKPEQRDALIRALATYLTDDILNKSVLVTLGHPDALMWAAMYQAAGIRPYATAEQAEATLKQLLE